MPAPETASHRQSGTAQWETRGRQFPPSTDPQVDKGLISVLNCVFNILTGLFNMQKGPVRMQEGLFRIDGGVFRLGDGL